jgi:hypothetical protein
MRTISTTVEIDAPPSEVWRVLTDGRSYPEWNPFIRSLEGELREGGALRTVIAPPGGRPTSFKPVVQEFVPEEKLAWLGRVVLPGVFDGAHSFTLTELPEGRTRFVQAETFSGVLVPLMGGVLRRTEEGFVAMNSALAARAARQPG